MTAIEQLEEDIKIIKDKIEKETQEAIIEELELFLEQLEFQMDRVTYNGL